MRSKRQIHKTRKQMKAYIVDRLCNSSSSCLGMWKASDGHIGVQLNEGTYELSFNIDFLVAPDYFASHGDDFENTCSAKSIRAMYKEIIDELKHCLLHQHPLETWPTFYIPDIPVKKFDNQYVFDMERENVYDAGYVNHLRQRIHLFDIEHLDEPLSYQIVQVGHDTGRAHFSLVVDRWMLNAIYEIDTSDFEERIEQLRASKEEVQ